MIVYLLYAPLRYGNAGYIRTRIREILDPSLPSCREAPAPQ